MEINQEEYEKLKAQSEQLATIRKSLGDRGFDSVEACILDRDTCATERDKAVEEFAKAGKTIARQGTDLGNARKEVDRLKQLVNEEGRTEPSENDGTSGKSAEEEVKELEARLTDKHWNEVLDPFYAQLPDEEAVKLATDPVARRELYKEVLKKAPVRPESLRSTVKQGNETHEQQKVSLLGKFLEEVGYSPSGPGVRSPRIVGKSAIAQHLEDTRTS